MKKIQVHLTFAQELAQKQIWLDLKKSLNANYKAPVAMLKKTPNIVSQVQNNVGNNELKLNLDNRCMIDLVQTTVTKLNLVQ